ncbi:type II toxin-antitoxin system PemK/MazF family toxin [Agrobacterium arsenijevicii]
MRGKQPHWDTTKLSINYGPKPREVYFIGTFEDSLEPEFTGYHPGVILSGAKTVRENVETVVFVPATTEEPMKNSSGAYPPYVHELSQNPSPTDGRRMWVICNHVMTVRLTRLERYIGPNGLYVPRVSKDDFNSILDAVMNGMTVLRDRSDHKKNVAVDAMSIQHEAILSALKAQHETEIETHAYALLEEKTKPASSDC